MPAPGGWLVGADELCGRLRGGPSILPVALHLAAGIALSLLSYWLRPVRPQGRGQEPGAAQLHPRSFLCRRVLGRLCDIGGHGQHARSMADALV